jgi:murein DD-endopeptidase MepM/ murein hydrolase activator NlpD
MRWGAIVSLAVGAAWASSLMELSTPIAGLTKADLRDTFIEVHSGHAHEAIDIMAVRGTPVHAVVNGRIAKLFLSKAGGNTIYEFDDKSEYSFYYAHLDRYAEGLKEGAQVRRGEVIGYVGFSGNASPDAPHLHFAVFELGPAKNWWKGRVMNPYDALLSAIQRSSSHP